MCNVVPSGAEAYGKLYPETSSDGVRGFYPSSCIFDVQNYTYLTL